MTREFPKVKKKNIWIAPWWLAAVYVMNSSFSMLSEWIRAKLKTKNVTKIIFFPGDSFSQLSSSYHVDFCSIVYFSELFGFNVLALIKRWGFFLFFFFLSVMVQDPDPFWLLASLLHNRMWQPPLFIIVVNLHVWLGVYRRGQQVNSNNHGEQSC